MSMSTQHGGGSRKPSTKPVAGAKPKQGGDEVDDDLDVTADPESTDASSASSDESAPEADTTSARPKASPRKSAPAKKAGTRPGASRPSARPGGKPTKRVAPVKVSQGRNWGPIALFTAVAVVAVGIIGIAGWQVYQNGLTWEDRAGRIDGLVNYRKTAPRVAAERDHAWGPVDYSSSPTQPPVAGRHNFNWQRCLGDVYPAQIATEHALHSLEHGAVWITYRPDLPADQVEQLATKVRGQDYLLMSPFPNQASPISLQAWGIQLKVNSASDPRVDEFIKLKQQTSLEPGTPCSSGSYITKTGTTPSDLGKDQPQQPTGG